MIQPRTNGEGRICEKPRPGVGQGGLWRGSVGWVCSCGMVWELISAAEMKPVTKHHPYRNNLKAARNIIGGRSG